MTDQLRQAASDLGFRRWYQVTGRTSVADLFPPSRRCGIYVLSFANSEAYVGQAVDVTRRYAQHRKTHLDIESMAFKVVQPDGLDQEERSVIRKLETAGIILRNVVFASAPSTESDFDQVMTAEDQGRWSADPTYMDLEGQRPEDLDLRRRYSRRYGQFAALAEANAVVAALRLYVHRGIPAPARSELSFWACTCLPNYRSSSEATRARINIYQQEVFAVYSRYGQLSFTWHLARSPLERAFGPRLSELTARFPSIEQLDYVYEPGGQDQIGLQVPGVARAIEFLSNPDVVRSVRLFNLRLMRKGPCMWSRYHCFDLADRLYEPETDTASAACPGTSRANDPLPSPPSDSGGLREPADGRWNRLAGWLRSLVHRD